MLLQRLGLWAAVRQRGGGRQVLKGPRAALAWPHLEALTWRLQSALGLGGRSAQATKLLAKELAKELAKVQQRRQSQVSPSMTQAGPLQAAATTPAHPFL
jgi:hypothetical protein